MRFNEVLKMPQNLKRLRDASWQRWRKLKIEDDGLKAKLEKTGVTVVDALEYVKADSPKYLDLESLPTPPKNFPQPPLENPSHPKWKERPVKILNSSNFPMEGVRQAQNFTQSVQLQKGLPKTIIPKELDKNIDTMVQREVQHAFLWDSHLDKLPKLRSLDIPSHNYEVPYGIQPQNAIHNLLRNFYKLCEKSHRQESLRRVIVNSEKSKMFGTLENGKYLTQFQLSPLISLYSKNLLLPNESPNAETNETVPNIHPFSPVLNFEESNIYDEEDLLGVSPDSSFPFLHTACFAHTIPGSFTHIFPRWNWDRFSGSTILYAFSSAMLMARRKFGPIGASHFKNEPIRDEELRKEPITVQVIHTTGKEFEFCVFQLNTLDLGGGIGKNFVWLSEKMKLFERCEVDFSTGRLVFEGYNPDVFRTFASFYETGTEIPFPVKIVKEEKSEESQKDHQELEKA